MTDNEQQEIEDRRKFLISAGRFAAVNACGDNAAIVNLSDAIAESGANGHGGPKRNNGYGNGGSDNSKRQGRQV